MSIDKKMDEASVMAIKEVLAELEVKRHGALIAILWQGAIVGVILAAICTAFIGDFVLSLIVGLIIGLGCAYLYNKAQLNNMYKKEVMPRLVSTLGSQINYSAQGGVNKQAFQSSRLFEVEYHDICTAEDHVSGIIGNTSFTFCKANYGYETERLNDENESETETTTLFDGLAIEIKLPHPLKGITLLCPKLPRHLKKSDFNEFSIEGSALTGRLPFFTTDETEVHNMIPSLQKDLISLAECVGDGKMKVSLHDQVMLVLLSVRKNSFQANMFSPIKMEQIEKDFSILHLMKSIVEGVNRVTSK